MNRWACGHVDMLGLSTAVLLSVYWVNISKALKGWNLFFLLKTALFCIWVFLLHHCSTLFTVLGPKHRLSGFQICHCSPNVLFCFPGLNPVVIYWGGKVMNCRNLSLERVNLYFETFADAHLHWCWRLKDLATQLRAWKSCDFWQCWLAALVLNSGKNMS